MAPSRLACFRARVSGGTDGCCRIVGTRTHVFFFFFNCCHLSAQCARTVALTGPPPPHVPSLARRGAPARLRHQCLRRTTGTDLCRAAHAPGGGAGARGRARLQGRWRAARRRLPRDERTVARRGAARGRLVVTWACGAAWVGGIQRPQEGGVAQPRVRHFSLSSENQPLPQDASWAHAGGICA